MCNSAFEREIMSEVLNRSVFRPANAGLPNAGLVTDLDRGRVTAFIQTSMELPRAALHVDTGGAMTTQAAVWQPESRRSLQVVEGVAAAAVMGGFLLFMGSMLIRF
jgi:hypothetical protein